MPVPQSFLPPGLCTASAPLLEMKVRLSGSSTPSMSSSSSLTSPSPAPQSRPAPCKKSLNYHDGDTKVLIIRFIDGLLC